MISNQTETFINKDIKHLEQTSKNDCGHACLKIAINYVCKETNDIDLIIKSLNLSEVSLWTIDIAHVCAIKQIKHVMFTKTLGVEDSYEAYDFYNKDKNFDSEKSRVNEKFAKSAQLSINVQKQSLSLDFIKGELLKKCVCILLVDAGKLKNAKNLDDDDSVFIDELDQNFLDCCLFKKSSITMQANNEAYCGHFIVVIGYDNTRNFIYYRNPALNKKLSVISQNSFELARKSLGTDEDIVFIYQEIH